MVAMTRHYCFLTPFACSFIIVNTCFFYNSSRISSIVIRFNLKRTTTFVWMLRWRFTYWSLSRWSFSCWTFNRSRLPRCNKLRPHCNKLPRCNKFSILLLPLLFSTILLLFCLFPPILLLLLFCLFFFHLLLVFLLSTIL